MYGRWFKRNEELERAEEAERWVDFHRIRRQNRGTMAVPLWAPAYLETIPEETPTTYSIKGPRTSEKLLDEVLSRVSSEKLLDEILRRLSSEELLAEILRRASSDNDDDFDDMPPLEEEEEDS